MNIIHLFLLVPLTMIAALVMVSCESDDSSCEAPLTINSGTWCITIQTTQNTCSTTLPNPYTANFVQTENYLSAISQYDHTYAGTICGNNVTMFGNNEGITTNMDIVFSNASSATGSVDWNNPGCSGTDTFIAVSGTCP